MIILLFLSGFTLMVISYETRKHNLARIGDDVAIEDTPVERLTIGSDSVSEPERFILPSPKAPKEVESETKPRASG